MKYLYFLLASLMIFSCKQSETTNIGDDLKLKFANGTFIVNAGKDTLENGSISFYDKYRDSFHLDLYTANNPSTNKLGSQLRSFNYYNYLDYVVSEGSNKVEVVGYADFKRYTYIDGFNRPQAIVPITNNLAYIPQWGNDEASSKIQVLDMSTISIVGGIDTPDGPSNILKVGDYVYVTCNGGDKGLGNEILKIDIRNNLIIKRIVTPDAPSQILTDKDNKIWVLCKGFKANQVPGQPQTASKIVLLKDDTVIKTIDLSTKVNFLTIDTKKEHIYYANDHDIFKLNYLSEIEPTTIFYHSDRPISAMQCNTFYPELWIGTDENSTLNDDVLVVNTDNATLDRQFIAGERPTFFYFSRL
ncbi:MAG: hypothetical protein KBA06_01035 [Saprospiraceae bacterium]|nr:hypothetical protein [Saprospiraceae bacterium]